MKCLNTNRHASRFAVSFVIKLEWSADCEKPGVSRRRTTFIVMTQPTNWNSSQNFSLFLQTCKLLSVYRRNATGWTVRDRKPARARFFSAVQICPGAHPGCCTIDIQSLSRGKAAEAWRWLSTPSITVVKEKSRATHLLSLWVFMACYRVNFTPEEYLDTQA
jgi:hypothetical protein